MRTLSRALCLGTLFQDRKGAGLWETVALAGSLVLCHSVRARVSVHDGVWRVLRRCSSRGIFVKSGFCEEPYCRRDCFRSAAFTHVGFRLLKRSRQYNRRAIWLLFDEPALPVGAATV